MRKAILLAACLAAMSFGAQGEDCRLIRYGTMPMEIGQFGGITVPIKVDDQAQNMLVDTGGAFSMLNEAAATRLNLSRNRLPFGTFMKGFGGRLLTHSVTAHTMEILGAKLRNHAFVLIPDDALPSGVDGLLSPDILQVFDVDFDFAAGKLSLFDQKHCEGKTVYWTQEPYAEIPFKMDEGWHIKIVVMLDGQEVPAILDTGASRSLMSLDTAEDIFKLDHAVLKANNNRYPFKTLTLQGVIVNNPDIILVPDEKSKIMGGYHQPKLLLGMGVLRQLHLYIAYKEHMIYVTAASAH